MDDKEKDNTLAETLQMLIIGWLHSGVGLRRDQCLWNDLRNADRLVEANLLYCSPLGYFRPAAGVRVAIAQYLQASTDWAAALTFSGNDVLREMEDKMFSAFYLLDGRIREGLERAERAAAQDDAQGGEA